MSDTEMGNSPLPMHEEYDLRCWYLNLYRLSELFRDPSFGLTLPKAEDDNLGRAGTLTSIKEQLVARLLASGPQTLGELIVSGRLQVGSLFTHHAPFYCEGLAAYLKKVSAGGHPLKFPSIYAKPDPLNPDKILRIEYDPAHLTSNSSSAHLKGHTSLFVLGVVTDLTDSAINASPYVIASLVLNWMGDPGPMLRWSPSLEVSVDEIESFSAIRAQKHPAKADLGLLKNVPEQIVKDTFAQIIGESFVHKDWAGERSDLFTGRLELRGRRVSSAFLLKGPSEFRPMTWATLGDQGDQIDRLFTEPADLLVVQHCHEITKAVRGAMRAYAESIRRPRYYCVIDGYDTLRLLRAYKPEIVSSNPAHSITTSSPP